MVRASFEFVKFVNDCLLAYCVPVVLQKSLFIMVDIALKHFISLTCKMQCDKPEIERTYFPCCKSGTRYLLSNLYLVKATNCTLG